MRDTTSVPFKIRGVKSEFFLRKDKIYVNNKLETEVSLVLRGESGDEWYIVSIAKDGTIYRNAYVDTGHGVKVDAHGFVKLNKNCEHDEIWGG